MDEGLRWRCELTPESIDGAEPELGAALAAWGDLVFEAARARRRIPERALRVAGLATAALGLLVSWAAIILAPECARGRGAAVLAYAAIPVFVVGGTVLGFLPGFLAEVRAWLRRSAVRRARRLLAPLRRRAPCAAEYELSGRRLEARVEPPGARHATDLAEIGGAVVGARVACLFRRGWPRGLRRVVWLPAAEGRAAVCEALRAAGVVVTGLVPRAP